MDKNRLFLQAIGKFLLGVIVIGLLLFLPAGSLQYWQGWLMMGILLVPMFCAGLVMLAKNPELLLAMPLVLASPLSFLIMLLYIPLIAKRIKNEEEVLEKGLEGYKEYKQKVKYKVIPFIW